MASQTLQRATPQASDDMHGPELSPESSATTRLTPDPDSDSDESDLEMGELGESFKLQRRETREVGGAAEDEDEMDEEKYRDVPRRRASVLTI